MRPLVMPRPATYEDENESDIARRADAARRWRSIEKA